MASTTPTAGKSAPTATPKAAASTPVVEAVAAKADPAAVKLEPTPVDAVKAVAEKVVAAVVKPAEAIVAAVTKPAPAPAAVSAKAVTPPAKKKAVTKPAPKTVAPKITVNTVKPVPAPAIARAKTVATKEVNIMEAQIKNVTDKAKTLLTDANAKGTKAFGEMNDFTKGNIEAMVESGKIAAKGMEAMGQDTAEFARKQFESATAAMKTLSTVKSPTDFFKLQGDYMRTYFDSLVAHSSQSTEKMLKLAGEVAQPIQNRVSVAVEKVKIAA